MIFKFRIDGTDYKTESINKMLKLVIEHKIHEESISKAKLYNDVKEYAWYFFKFCIIDREIDKAIKSLMKNDQNIMLTSNERFWYNP